VSALSRKQTNHGKQVESRVSPIFMYYYSPHIVLSIQQLSFGRIAGNTLRRSSPYGSHGASKKFSTLGSAPTPTFSLITYVGFASIVAVGSMAEAETTKCDTAAAQLRLSSHFQGQRSNDISGRVISLQGLDLYQASNETAERLIDALNDGAQFDKESLVILMSMGRRLSTATAEKLIAAVNNGASFDKESLIKLVRLQLTAGPLGS
jgi:hypothetical protein